MKPVASNEIGSQAMRGRGVFATQLHPEADLPIISRWSSGDGQLELAKSGIDLANLIEYSRARCAEASVAACRLVDWFLEFANTSERNLIQDNRYEIKSC